MILNKAKGVVYGPSPLKIMLFLSTIKYQKMSIGNNDIPEPYGMYVCRNIIIKHIIKAQLVS